MVPQLSSLSELVLAGDLVARRLGDGDTAYGRVIARAEDSTNRWLVATAGHIYRDWPADLRLLSRPWPVSGAEQPTAC